MGFLILRSSASVAAAWADVFVTAANVGPELATNGRVVGIRGSAASDWEIALTANNGGSVTRVANASFDSNEDAIEIIPPSGPNAEYVGILNAVNLRGTSNTVRQINLRWLAYHGSTYWSHSTPTKLTGFLMSATNSYPADAPKRAAVFDNRWPTGAEAEKVFAVTYGTTQSYHEPDSGIDIGADVDKLCFLRSSANHSNNPPIIGPEWVCFEQIVTTPGYNSQSDGRNKLVMWTRDGVVSEAYLDIPFSYAGADYDSSKIYLISTEYLGGYFNDAGTADANNFARYSHCAFSANRSLDSYIGPPPGFLL